MEFIRGIHNLRSAHRGSVATIGNYDGVHLGHRAVLGSLIETGQRLGLPSVVMCFEPTPQEFFRPQAAPPRLTLLREKFLELEKLGIDRFLCVRFNDRVAALSPDDFVRRLLVDGIGVRHLVVGDDFRFGRDRAGDYHTLVEAGGQHGFDVAHTASFNVDGRRASSTAIRGALASGDLALAGRLLGRPYTMSGRVVRGQQLGRDLGFPTANVRVRRPISPLAGVFAIRVHGLGEPRPGVASLGTRPTVETGKAELLLESHLFDFDGNIYGRRIEVEFVERLRDELRFQKVEALMEQMREDARRARDILGCAPGAG